MTSVVRSTSFEQVQATYCSSDQDRDQLSELLPATVIPAAFPSAANTTFGFVGSAFATDSSADPVNVNSMDPKNSAQRAITYLVFVKCSAWVCKSPGMVSSWIVFASSA